MISDVVLTKELPQDLKRDKDLLTGCVSGAILKQDYLLLLKKTGFKNIEIHKEIPMFLENYALSITFSAFKWKVNFTAITVNLFLKLKEEKLNFGIKYMVSAGDEYQQKSSAKKNVDFNNYVNDLKNQGSGCNCGSGCCG